MINAALYTVDILRLAASLPEPRPLDRVDGSAEVRSPTCGSTIRAEVMRDDAGRIAALSLTAHACAFGQASAALAARHAEGRDQAEIDETLTALRAWLSGGDTLPSWPGIEVLAPARSRTSRHAAILLPFRALSAAIGTQP